MNQLNDNPTIYKKEGNLIIRIKRIYRHMLNPISLIKPYKEVIVSKIIIFPLERIPKEATNNES